MAWSKQDLRREAQARRHLLAAPRAGERAAKLFLDVFRPALTDIVGAYWPHKMEIDTRPLLNRLNNNAIVCALPMVQKGTRQLRFHLWKPGQALSPGTFGTMEPSPAARVVLPSIFVVPLMAFDRHGYRIGYGTGYYDETLKHARRFRSITAVGFAFDGQLVEEIPRQAHDEPLDWIVTASQVIKAEPKQLS